MKILNNHVLTNSISQLFYGLHLGFWWSMRLPALLVGRAGTLDWYGVLQTNFRVVTLAVGLFSCLQFSLFQSAAGRGYVLLAALSVSPQRVHSRLRPAADYQLRRRATAAAISPIF